MSSAFITSMKADFRREFQSALIEPLVHSYALQTVERISSGNAIK